MADQPGFTIQGRFYPFPAAFRLGDPVLVRELTGLGWEQFAELLDDDRGRNDPVTLTGLVGVAVWQQHPQWRRDRVVRYVESLNLAGIVFTGGDQEADEGDRDAGPPAEAGAGSSPPSEPTSNEPPASGLESTSPPSSGSPGSDTGSPASPLTG